MSVEWTAAIIGAVSGGIVSWIFNLLLDIRRERKAQKPFKQPRNDLLRFIDLIPMGPDNDLFRLDKFIAEIGPARARVISKVLTDLHICTISYSSGGFYLKGFSAMNNLGEEERKHLADQIKKGFFDSQFQE